MHVCGPTLPEWGQSAGTDPSGPEYVRLCDLLLVQYVQYLVSSGQQKLAASYIVLLSTKQQVAQGLASLFEGLVDGEGIQVQEEHLEVALQAMQSRDNWCLELEDIGNPRLMVSDYNVVTLGDGALSGPGSCTLCCCPCTRAPEATSHHQMGLCISRALLRCDPNCYFYDPRASVAEHATVQGCYDCDQALA